VGGQTPLKHGCRQFYWDRRLLVIELVLMPGNDPSLGKPFDLLMLVDLGGRERTEADYRTLLAGAGFPN